MKVMLGTEWEGNPVRVARKEHRCNNYNVCSALISPGDMYLEGDRNETAGGFGYDRYCSKCFKKWGGVVSTQPSKI